MTILLVEDDPNDVRLILHALDPPVARQVQVLGDGAAALEHLLGAGDGRHGRPRRPTVILLDLKLPLVDGIEVLQAVKADERTRTIPVVMLTSSAEQQDVQACYRLGVNSYIVKPVTTDALFSTIREAQSYWLTINHHQDHPASRPARPR